MEAEMNDYEFWKEIGKIFNAVVAYQEKSVEFNKQFINPWIRLGNVFDKQDHNTDAINEYQKAVELDPANAQNWYELGNAYFRTESYDDANNAYSKALNLDPNSGWSYSNLAFTLMKQGKYTEALPLYQKGIDLLQLDKDKAIVWNRLGNLYRKLNEYDLAVDAFQTADDLDEENAGFRDELDDAPDEPILAEGNHNDEVVNEASPSLAVPPDIADSPTEESISSSELLATDASEVSDVDNADETQKTDVALGPVIEPDATDEIAGQTIMVTAVETNTEPEIMNSTMTQNIDWAQIPADSQVVVEVGVTEHGLIDLEPAVVPTNSDPIADTEIDEASHLSEAVAAKLEEKEQSHGEDIPEETLDVSENNSDENVVPAQSAYEEFLKDNSSEPQACNPEPNSDENVVPAQSAFEEFLKDNNGEPEVLDPETNNEEINSADSQQEPAARIDSSGEVQIEADPKNARVWNELGNVYFNTGAYDDAITAYSKAIELDDQFAWPYSNLALTYVQRERFAEAILLYQRSIELFASEKDKAVSWNRLGNVYRRVNDYDNAILAYQKADELDPDNITLSLQSRFSLLGNYFSDSKPIYMS
jgi:superkiller protein 3